MTERFDGHVVLVTGSATGIGEATALRFASEGAAVACLDVHVKENEATAEAVAALGVDALALTCDVRSRAAQEQAFATVVEQWGRIDTLVTSAGNHAADGVLDGVFGCKPCGGRVLG